MRASTLPLLGATLVGFLAALAVLYGTRASAQFKPNNTGLPLINTIPAAGSTAPAIQPIEVEGLDATHFVVASREPRLVQQIGRDGTAQQMIVPVVTYYSVSEGKLVPVEHVRVPTGFRLISLGDE